MDEAVGVIRLEGGAADVRAASWPGASCEEMGSEGGLYTQEWRRPVPLRG